ncbi:MAG TPA: hypothetical protein VIN72_10455 [Lutibacter sp.]
MEKDLDYLAFQLAQRERKIASINRKIAFLNKLLVAIGFVILLFYIYK